MIRLIALISWLIWAPSLNSWIDEGRDIWKILYKVKFQSQDDVFGAFYDPIFTDEIKALEGQEITATGFIIPFEGLFQPDKIILSSLPVDACFFCGNGGPETVIEVHLKKNIQYTNKAVKVKGQLKLNNDNFEELIYVLEEAELIEILK